MAAPINVGALTQAKTGLLGLSALQFNPLGSSNVATGSVMTAIDSLGDVAWAPPSAAASSSGGVVFFSPVFIAGGNSADKCTSTNVCAVSSATFNASSYIPVATPKAVLLEAWVATDQNATSISIRQNATSPWIDIVDTSATASADDSGVGVTSIAPINSDKTFQYSNNLGTGWGNWNLYIVGYIY